MNHKEDKNMVKKMNQNQEIKFSKVWTEFLEYKRKMVEGGKITVATFKKYEWLYNRYVKDTDLDQCNVEELTTAKVEEYIIEMVKENELSRKETSDILFSIRQIASSERFLISSEIAMNSSTFISLMKIKPCVDLINGLGFS